MNIKYIRNWFIDIIIAIIAGYILGNGLFILFNYMLNSGHPK